MDANSSLLTYLAQCLGRGSTPVLLVVALALMVATFLVALAAADVLAGVAEPIISAPFRWFS